MSNPNSKAFSYKTNSPKKLYGKKLIINVSTE